MSRFFSYIQSDGQQHARVMADSVIRGTFFVACVFFKDTMKTIDKIHSKSVIFKKTFVLKGRGTNYLG